MAHTITSTRLRKHVSTMVQLLNLKDHELDALAQFLGHDIRVHRKHYRLQDETIQLAKISKILVNFNNGKLSSMKGKSLDEIEVNDFSDSESDNANEDNTDNEDFNIAEQESLRNYEIKQNITKKNSGEQVKKSSVLNKKEKTRQERKQIIKRKWTTEEAKIVSNEFKDFLLMKKLPGKKDIEEFMNKNKEILQNRTWKNIKDFLYGKLKKVVEL
ncbi:hypothetical protein NQ314_006451 [Rhamnusium bicolor]|uniref:Protein TIC 214 n=1 Tax=Rhamnusium bicolor TaxID=1586634 RepID=A0AAV8Z4K5_9CUCU|nr:hypothetical protein NQ314_006451 [Rhamnusium bicolor]